MGDEGNDDLDKDLKSKKSYCKCNFPMNHHIRLLVGRLDG